MHRTILIVVLTLMAVCCLWFSGCGDSDLLDEMNQRYTASISFEDADDTVLTLDIWQNPDCDGAANTTDPEPFTDVFADITVSVSADAPGITLEGYTIDFIPQESDNGTGTYYLPPDLADVDDAGSHSISISSGGSATFRTTCMTMSAKDAYYSIIAADANFNEYDYTRYTIRYTLYFTDEYTVERVIEVEKTVELGRYDNC